MPFVLGALAGIGIHEHETGDPQQAAEWLALAINHPACFNSTKEDVERALADKAEFPERLSHINHRRLDLDREVDRILR